ncbi:MAG: sigma-70 family RNA polymerase sigma factor [Pirellulales bacterium]
MADATRILSQLESGDPTAAEQLLPLIYDELRKLAAAKLAQEKPGQTLQATALVHEAYLRLVGPDRPEASWENRGHFFAAAAEAMRRILIEQARAKKTAKRGAGLQRVELDDRWPEIAPPEASAEDLLSLDEALGEFERISPAQAKLVKLRYFAGLSLEEAALATGVSVATAKRRWVYARSWLFGKLHAE